ncbi:MAG: diguanylate cyclase [Campylobacteraceae bacterium]|nr:diguanylate cyclase [Campylobacteraceae bacterium]
MNNKATYIELEEKIINLEKKLSNLDLLKKERDIQNSFLKTLFDTIPSPIFYKDKNGIYQQCNDAFSKNILGIEKEKIIGKTLFDLPVVINLENAKIYKKKDEELLQNQEYQVYETKVKCKDGILRDYNFYKSTYSLDGEVLGIVGLMLDVSDYKSALKEIDEKNKILNDVVNIDWLSNLYNRKYFADIFEKKISSLYRNNLEFSFAILDIDYFKYYNDTFGHVEGDNVIKKISELMQNTFQKANDYVFRLGGEEFGILFESKNSKEAYYLINKLRLDIQNAGIKAGNIQVCEYVTVSIGLLNIKKLNKDMKYSKLYFQADNLLYKAKNEGRNKVCVLDYSFNE